MTIRTVATAAALLLLSGAAPPITEHPKAHPKVVRHAESAGGVVVYDLEGSLLGWGEGPAGTPEEMEDSDAAPNRTTVACVIHGQDGSCTVVTLYTEDGDIHRREFRVQYVDRDLIRGEKNDAVGTVKLAIRWKNRRKPFVAIISQSDSREMIELVGARGVKLSDLSK